MSSETEETEGVDARTMRAATEVMTVFEEADGLYEVITESGNSYNVKLDGPACTCPDFEHRDVRCKHIRHVELRAGKIDVDRVRDKLEERKKKVEKKAEELEAEREELEEAAGKIGETIEGLAEVEE
jgi:hypothetical protein